MVLVNNFDHLLKCSDLWIDGFEYLNPIYFLLIEYGVAQGGRWDTPVDASETGEICFSEIKTATREQDDTPLVVYRPEATSMAAILTVRDEVAMKANVPELQGAVQCDNEFLHILSIS